MQDTTPEIKQKQFEIIFSKTEAERLMMGLEMMDDMRKMVMQRIRSENHDLSETELRVRFVTRYYKNDFTPEQFTRIVEWLRGAG